MVLYENSRVRDLALAYFFLKVSLYLASFVRSTFKSLFCWFGAEKVHEIDVPLEETEASDDCCAEVPPGVAKGVICAPKGRGKKDVTNVVHCWDPATGGYLGTTKAMDYDDVDRAVCLAKEAQEEWKLTTFEQRRAVLRTLNRYILSHKDDIVRVCCKDTVSESGSMMNYGSLAEPIRPPPTHTPITRPPALSS